MYASVFHFGKDHLVEDQVIRGWVLAVNEDPSELSGTIVPCPPDTEALHAYDGLSFNPEHEDMDIHDVRKLAVEVIKDAHAESLGRLTGNERIEVRDTWERQSGWANNFLDIHEMQQLDPDVIITDRQKAKKEKARKHLTGLLVDPELEQLQAANIDPAYFMAQKIISKADPTDDLIEDAGNARRGAELYVENATSELQIVFFLSTLPDLLRAREQAFLSSQNS